MTPRQESNLERTVGRIEAQLEHFMNHLASINEKLDHADDWRQEVKQRLERVEQHNKNLGHVADAFQSLQQSIRDGKMQARGVVIGVGLAAGAGGATMTALAQKVWSALVGS